MSPEYNPECNKGQNLPTSQFGQSFVLSIVAIALLTIVLPLAIPSKVAPTQSNPTDSKIQTKASVQKLGTSLDRQSSPHHSNRLTFEQDAIA